MKKIILIIFVISSIAVGAAAAIAAYNSKFNKKYINVCD